jgi:glycosyltransferase involved in cell wall biosynthesis
MVKSVILARGGALGRNTGLGGAHHNLLVALKNGNIKGYQLGATCEYDLALKSNPVRRLLMRWWSHPRVVKRFVNSSTTSDNCDILHITDQEQAHLVPKNCKVPVVVTVHDIFHLFPKQVKIGQEIIQVGEAKPPIYRSRDLKKLKSGLMRADLLVCDSRATLSDCKKYFPNVKSICIPLGLDIDAFANFAQTDSQVIGPAQNLPEGCNLLIVGSHDPRKRLKFICEVLGGLDDSIKNEIHIHHVGNAECPYGGPSTHHLAKQNNIQNWNGIGTNLSHQELMWMRIKSDALLFPSGSEGFGYPPLESMACGTKVLCSNLASHNELMPDDYCIEAGDIVAWQKAIVELHSQWKQRLGPIDADQQLIKHSRNFSMDTFNERMAEAYSMME